MCKQKIIVLIVFVSFLSSCIDSNVRFISPQPKDLGILEKVPEIMKNAYDLRVDLEVNMSFGSTWADAKG